MFDGLRKKLSSFVNAVVEKAAGKAAEAQEAPAPAAVEAKAPEPLPVEAVVEEPVAQEIRTPEKKFVDAQEIEAPEKKFVEKQIQAPPAVPAASQKEDWEPARSPAGGKPREQIDFGPKLGLLSRVKSVFSPEIRLKQEEIEPVLHGLEMALLESDVSFDASQEFVKQLRSRLAGKSVRVGSAGQQIREEIRSSLLALFPENHLDLFNFVLALKNNGEVAVILFVGPNGSGKTTTIAKLAKQFEERGVATVIAAGDTFRKAAIEQARFHGEKLGVKVVSHQYGSDPTAVAFDAVQHAKTAGKAVVLVDTAGRQETNYNLVREMEKMNRVLKPSLKLFVGEAIAGNALTEQVRQFHDSIKLDGIILTKLDCDAKGGGAFSVAFETGLPVLMVGVGQEYADLKPFDAEWLCDRVLAG